MHRPEASCNDPFVLLDKSRVFDENMVALLDDVVDAMFDSGNAQKRETAHKILEEFKSMPDTWKHVALILSKSTNSNTKFFALQVLQICIQSRWNILPQDERTGIKQYVSELVIKLCMDDEICANEKHFLTKINESLIQIVKKEWPDKWDNFISEICKASHVSQNICENNMRLLNMLSEELFDFGEDHMQSRRVQKLMSRMTAEFREIYDVCLFVLNSSIQNPERVRVSLVKQTLTCLAHFLKWIPYGYIFEAYLHNDVSIVLVDLLLDHFWEPVVYRIECTKCLTEIASLSLQGQELQTLSHRIAKMWPKLVDKVSLLPISSMNYDDSSRVPPAMRLFWETFYVQFSLLLTNFLKNFRENIVEQCSDNKGSLLFVLERLVLITDINHEETFKITLDYWHHFANQLLKEAKEYEKRKAAELGIIIRDDSPVEIFNRSSLNLNPIPESLRISVYRPILIEVQKVFIKKMAKPQEIYIMYDTDACEVTREYNPNTAEIALYNRMRTTQIILTTILQEDTERIMMEVLEKEMEIANVGGGAGHREVWDPTILNRLCYSVGSITGAMEEHVEKRFLVLVIKCLLNICEIKTATANKAIVASSIMYVVGQYPRFLKTNWRFLNTVLNKLFEFMRETFPGVQQMACETFLKITNSCKKVIASQSSVDGSYVSELIQLRDPMTEVLDEKLILWYYESVGNVISATRLNVRESFIEQLMERCNCEWNTIIMNEAMHQQIPAISDLNVWNEQKGLSIYQVDRTRAVIQILRINNRIAKSTGFAYTKQLLNIYQSMIHIYSLYTAYIQNSVRVMGPACFKHNNINMMHLAKRSILHLLETYILHIPKNLSKNLVPCNTYGSGQQTSITDSGESAVEMELLDDGNVLKCGEVLKQLVDSIISNILLNYKNSIADTRDHEVLCLITTLIEKIGVAAIPVLPQIFEQIFDCTLDMVKLDFHSFPDHREQFYELLQKCTKHCFEGLLQLPSERLCAYVMSLIWAFKHEHPTVAEKGLLIILEFLKNLVLYDKKIGKNGKQCNDSLQRTINSSTLLSFCKSYYYLLLKEILGVLTDTLHKSGFRLQTEILKTLIRFLECGLIDDPSSDLTRISTMRYLVDLISRSFSTLHSKQVEAFVVDLFNYASDATSEREDTPNYFAHPAKFQTHVRDFLLSLKEFAGSGEEFDAIFEQDIQNAIERARAIEMKKNQTQAMKEVVIE